MQINKYYKEMVHFCTRLQNRKMAFLEFKREKIIKKTIIGKFYIDYSINFVAIF